MAPEYGERPDPIEQLRAKYAELTRKYTELVRRLELKNERSAALYRMGYLSLQLAGAGIAVIDKGRITFTAEFQQLSDLFRQAKPWHGVKNDVQYDSLRRLVTMEASRLPGDRAASVIRRFESQSGDLTFEVRLERVGDVTTALVRDVTEAVHTEVELMRTREAMLQKERLRILGVLAAGVAHDLGTTLRAASFYVAALLAKHKGRRGDLHQLGRAVDWASDTVRRLHSFATLGHLRVEDLDLAAILRDAIEVVSIHAKQQGNISFRQDLRRLPVVRAGPGEVSQLFVNVLMNAVEAMPDGGVVYVGARAQEDKVLVTVSDQGIGIPPENREKLFQPFFTTKGMDGTGLGLWLASSTMARLGGTIQVDSKLKRGTSFRIEFPVAGSSAAEWAQRASVAALIRPSRPARAAAPPAPGAPGARRSRRARRT